MLRSRYHACAQAGRRAKAFVLPTCEPHDLYEQLLYHNTMGRFSELPKLLDAGRTISLPRSCKVEVVLVLV